MNEEPRESGEVQRSARLESLDPRSERQGERLQRLFCRLREHALGLDVEHADDPALGAERNGDLGPDAGERSDVVRVRTNVRDELRATEPDRPARDPALHRDPVRDDRVAALRCQPQPAVLEDEDRGQDAGDGIGEGSDRGLDRGSGLAVVPSNLVGCPGRSRGQMLGVDGALKACRR